MCSNYKGAQRGIYPSMLLLTRLFTPPMSVHVIQPSMTQGCYYDEYVSYRGLKGTEFAIICKTADKLRKDLFSALINAHLSV